MGTDIHGVVQVRKDGVWQTVCEGYRDRNYDAFAILADVRNGRGFANVLTGSGFIPIAEPRGFPAGFPIDGEFTPVPFQPKYSDPGDKMYWMGDHSHSHVTLAEILAADRGITIRKFGIVTEDIYRGWDKVGRPREWCGGVGGGGNVVLSEHRYAFRIPEQNNTRVYIEIAWNETYGSSANGLFEWADGLREFGAPEDVRFVFGFDS